jgi:hypothetical protein
MHFHVCIFFSLSLLALASQWQEQQIVLTTPIEKEFETPRPQPTLADLLTIERTASIFYSYARELELSARFEDESVEWTLFVPTNKAVMALARKP